MNSFKSRVDEEPDLVEYPVEERDEDLLEFPIELDEDTLPTPAFIEGT